MLLRWLIPFASLWLSASAWAADTPISFEQALADAVAGPEVASGRRAARLLEQARADDPELTENPTVRLRAGGRLTPETEQGVEAGLGIEQVFNLEGATGARRDALAAEAQWITAETSSLVLARRLATASAWLDLRQAEEQSLIAGRAVENEAQLLLLLQRLQRAGELTAGDVAAGRVRLEEAKLELLQLEGALAKARADLSAQIGAPTSGVFVAKGGFPELPAPTSEQQDRLLAQAKALPTVQAKRLLAKSERLRALEDRANRGLELSLGVDAYRDAPGALVVVGTVGLPLPVMAPGHREFAARDATRIRISGEVVAEEHRAGAEVLLALHEIEHSEEVFQALRDRLLPTTEQALAIRERQLAAGETTILDVLDAKRALHSARSRIVSAERERAWAKVKIAALSRSVGEAP